MSARDFRPGPALTKPATRIYDGSGVLKRRFIGWLWCEEPTPLRVAGRVVGMPFAFVGAWNAVQADPSLMWWLTGGWLIAAWNAEEDDQEQDADDEEEPDEGLTDAEFIELVRALAPDGPGAHLVEIADRLNKVEPGRAWDTADVREIAGRIDLPIHSTRSPNRNGSSTGIRTKDLPPPSPDDDGAPVVVVAAGQPSDNDNDDITVERIGESGLIGRDRPAAARRQAVRPRRSSAA